jgi:hypothetical protein
MLSTTIVVVNNNLPLRRAEALESEVMTGSSQVPRTAQITSGIAAAFRAASKPETAAAQSDVMDDEIALDALAGHAGYAVRRFQIWIFSGFCRTLAAVDIRPTQYSVLTVIGAQSEG